MPITAIPGCSSARRWSGWVPSASLLPSRRSRAGSGCRWRSPQRRPAVPTISGSPVRWREIQLPDAGEYERLQRRRIRCMRAKSHRPGDIAVTAGLEAEDARSWSNLMVAAEKGDAQAVRAELAAGADLNQTDEGGWSALHLAAHNARIAVLEALIAHPAIDINSRNKWKSTPLSLAAAKGHFDCIQAL